jgi:hypothetical protein
MTVWVVLSRLIDRRVGIRAGVQWEALRAPVIALVPAWGVARLVAEALGAGPSIVSVTAAAAAGLVVFGAVGTLAERRLMPDAARQVTKLLRRTPVGDAATVSEVDSVERRYRS